jgi:hypothetical protein
VACHASCPKELAYSYCLFKPISTLPPNNTTHILRISKQSSYSTIINAPTQEVLLSSPKSTIITCMMETPVHDPEHDPEHDPDHDDDDDYWDESSSLSSQSFIQYSDNRECSACHRTNIARFKEYWSCTLVELENAASQNGCIQCQPIYELIKLFVPDGFQDGNTIKIAQDWRCTLSISSSMRGRPDHYKLDIFRLHGENCRHFSATSKMLKMESSESNLTNCDIWKDVPIRSPFLGSTGSEETLQWIKKWIKKCDSEHTLCAPTRNSAQLHGPKRILDLRFGTIRLRDDYQEEYSYACLSHCVRISVP